MPIDKNYILWLPSWYPNLLEPYNGDFIQRHAVSIASHQSIKVIYIIKDEKAKITKDFFEEDKVNNGVAEKIIYYHVPSTGISLLDKYFSYKKYKKLYQKAINKTISDNGKPLLTHVYIAMKSGIIARWIKKVYQIPYVITEQWTIYLDEAQPNFKSVPFYLKRKWKKIFEEASGISVVSDYLGNQLKKLFKIKSFELIPNVVNTEIFQPLQTQNKSVKEFIHISTLNYQKNPEDMLRAFSMIKAHSEKFILHIVGPDNPALVQLVNELNLTQNVRFHNEMLQSELVKLVQTSDALILYSRYETFGCVLIEANACGVPVIVSDVPVFHENVQEGFNGILAKNEDPAALAEKLSLFLDNQYSFRKNDIITFTKDKFSYKRIGTMYSEWYKSIINRTQKL